LTAFDTIATGYGMLWLRVAWGSPHRVAAPQIAARQVHRDFEFSLSMFVYISFRDESTKDWHSAIARELAPSTEQGAEVLALRGARVTMPNGQVIAVSATYVPSTRTISVHAALDRMQLIGVSGFKTQDAGFDPSIVFRTPLGMYISIMVGPMQPGDDAMDEMSA
ncbi:MAG TPA: hypothetical protein VEV20_07690, partial [Burkholderiales bacterium]|nr:hypothetical protein [Burkholderiales bacterium]